MFIVAGLFLTVSIGGFMSLIFTSGMKDGWKKYLVGTILAFAVGFGIAGIIMLECETDKAIWNNGNCSCGYEWELIDIERTRHGSTFYYYGCDNCGKVVELNTNYGK